MTDTDLLNAKIAECGITKRAIARNLGISEQSLRNKIANRQDFRQGEIVAMCSTLRLGNAERNKIFFA